MGFFGVAITDGATWLRGEDVPDIPRWLHVEVIDSDIAVIQYHPAYDGAGVAYAGWTPRTYYEDDSVPATDKPREVLALSQWFREAHIPLQPGALDALLVGEGDEGEADFVEEALEEFFSGTILGAPVFTDAG